MSGEILLDLHLFHNHVTNVPHRYVSAKTRNNYYTTTIQYLLKLVRFVKVRDLPTAEDIVYVLKEYFIYHLGIVEDEYSWFVINTCLPVQSL